MPDQTVLPRWRGFNLLELFSRVGPEDRRSGEFREDDFRWIADLGFDFIRIPMDYQLWADPGDPYKVKEPVLEQIDRVIRLGERYGQHISLNIHAAPGYCINPKPEPFGSLWRDPEALRAFSFYWGLFARRYRGIPAARLSFNLLNEPRVRPEEGTRDDYIRVVEAAVAAIREGDPDRLVISDGLDVGRTPIPELVKLGIAQACRAYDPQRSLTHYRAGWGQQPTEPVPVPEWPQPASHPGGAWDHARLEAHYQPWFDLAKQGVGVHCGEGGCYKYTPHPVVLAWLNDVLDVLTSHGVGYALWNFRGPFGILDSEREDVQYEDFHGHQLDRKLLDLLQRY